MPTRDRAEWLQSRHDRMLDNPNPLRVGYINCGAASWPGRPQKVARILREAAERVDLLLFSEAFNVDAHGVLGFDWDVLHNTSSGAKAGSGVAIRRTRGHIKRRKLVLAVRAVLFGRRADRMRDRWAAKAVLRIDPGTPHRWTLRVAAVHAPPPRNRLWWAPFMTRVDRIKADVLAGDWNALRPAVRSALGDGRRIHMHDIDGIATADWLPTSGLDGVEVGSDHPLVVLSVWG